MNATVGDRILIKATRLDEPVRDGEIVGVPHSDGAPPYLVRWSDSGRTTLIFPGPDSHIVHYDHDAACHDGVMASAARS